MRITPAVRETAGLLGIGPSQANKVSLRPRIGDYFEVQVQ